MSKSKWVEELLNVLWAIQTSLRGSTNETPFPLVCGIEVVITIELIAPTYRATMKEEDNNSKRSLNLVLVEELRDKSRIFVDDQK